MNVEEVVKDLLSQYETLQANEELSDKASFSDWLQVTQAKAQTAQALALLRIASILDSNMSQAARALRDIAEYGITAHTGG